MEEIGFAQATPKIIGVYFCEYEKSYSRTVDQSIEWDKNYVSKGIKEGKIDPNTLNSFLLGGCASPVSLRSMERFIADVRPNNETLLYVIDNEPTAIARISSATPTTGIDRRILLADLLDLTPKVTDVDYVRLDYLQNFIPPSRQVELLLQLRRILSPHGIISSVLMVVHEGKEFARGEDISGKFIPEKYFSGKTYTDPQIGMKVIDLSRNFIHDLSEVVGLKVEFGEQRVIHGYTRVNTDYDPQEEKYYRQLGYETHPIHPFSYKFTAVDSQHIIWKRLDF